MANIIQTITPPKRRLERTMSEFLNSEETRENIQAKGRTTILNGIPEET